MQFPITSPQPSALPSVASPQRQLRLAQKFILLGLLALVMAALPTGLYFRSTAPVIASAELENSGIAPLLATFVNAPALAERLGQLRAQGTGYLATWLPAVCRPRAAPR